MRVEVFLAGLGESAYERHMVPRWGNLPVGLAPLVGATDAKFREVRTS